MSFGDKEFFDSGLSFDSSSCLSKDKCGLTPALGQTRIMGGSAARLGQFPWVAYLNVRGPDIDKMCAGTLIADRSEAARRNYNYKVFQAFGVQEL